MECDKGTSLSNPVDESAFCLHPALQKQIHRGLELPFRLCIMTAQKLTAASAKIDTSKQIHSFEMQLLEFLEDLHFFRLMSTRYDQCSVIQGM